MQLTSFLGAALPVAAAAGVAVSAACLLVPALRGSLHLRYVPLVALLASLLALPTPGASAATVALVFVAGVIVVVRGLVPPVRFPRPTGPYGVGTVVHRWSDPGRPEILSEDPDEIREIVAQIWYPYRATSGPRSRYMEDAGAVFSSLLAALKDVTGGRTALPAWLLGHLGHTATNAILEASIAPEETPYPVVVYLSGLGGFRTSNTVQVEELASHGYVVVGIDQPYISASAAATSGGRRIPMLPRTRLYARHDPGVVIAHLAPDVDLVLARLDDLHGAGQDEVALNVDLRRVGVFGISLGGKIAAEACRRNERIGACLMYDAAMPASVVASGLRAPAMWLTRPVADMRREHRRSGGWDDDVIEETITSTAQTLAKQPQGTGFHIAISGMSHIDFTDAPSWAPLLARMGPSGSIGVRRARTIVNAFTLAFFDATLRGIGVPLPDNTRFPEVECTVY
ncbi:alpha/beta hydrolase family protein [Arthrobacter sp. CG_A4]|uniref:alpha/beta hydrolase family protein n=1 Tax=Arthrobacter sp. CG_A4 TaxID=3071706 RepID=UPI002E04BE93|nr:putative dienelactone hydrolase [Arthrobacter sp. CG_A4]